MKGLLLAATLLAASPVAAQSYDIMDRAQCEALIGRADMLGLGAPVTVQVLAPEAGFCRYEDLLLRGPSAAMDYALDRASVRVGGAGRLEHGLPPEALELRIEGAHFRYNLPEAPLTAWLMTEQGRAGGGVNLAVRTHWDRPGRRVVIEEVRADFPWRNSLRVTGEIANVDLTDRLATQRSLPGAGLARLELEVQSEGLFEALALLPLGQLLLAPQGDPALEVEVLKQRAESFVAGLSAPLVDAPSRAALAALIADLPHPAGRARLTLEAAPPVGLGQLLPFLGGAGALLPGGVERALERLAGQLRVSVSYDPTAP